ncbi:MAG: tRNA (guanosine(46)-N7)-methyltransferase TrmB [Bacilli bacterium]|nr:tRNA (guanosine(46)-N7)-methyltransferase TrmB [Bacilli bacterium]
MQYNKIKNADSIINKSNYLIRDPERYKNNWHSVFNNGNPINLELGMGRGEFIINMALKYPNINFIGVELSKDQLVMPIQKLATMKIPNLRILNMDAHDIDKVFGKEIDTIYLTFSEPWPKKIDEKKRFTHENYLRIYDKIFKKHKHIIMKTDNKGLFAYSLESLSQYWYSFDRVSLDLHHDENPIDNIMTDFEKQYYKENRPIYYFDASFKN